ncbi:hypothetical protein KBX37_03815, partial [Micromonospora sp. U56]|nr:hypothetical protein [Micromonospora sp. U56]
SGRVLTPTPYRRLPAPSRESAQTGRKQSDQEGLTRPHSFRNDRPVVFADPTQAPAWHTIPSWGLVATADKAIPAKLERFEYERAGARKVVEVSGASYSVMASQPGYA